jgi:putative aminopeptidase FrvX
MTNQPINQQKMYQKLKDLVNIDSPTGFTHNAEDYCFNALTEYGWQPKYTNKRVVTCSLGESPKLAIAAHLDTLGGIVSKINDDGTLQISKVGGLNLNGFEGGYCRIYTLDGEIFTGTLLLNNPAAHANSELNKAQRAEKNMHIRLDETVEDAETTQKLGISIGDFICFEPNYIETASGFVKSRFMDNKAGCYVLFEIAKRIKEKGWNVPVELFFSNYEEVGHGGTVGYSDTIEELLVIDMGVLGDGLDGKETACSICAKDSSGPYDYAMRKQLTKLAKAQKIPYAVDIYPFYGSDGSAALRAGLDFRVALIGPGVSASHGTERTHKDGIEATIDLCMAYIAALFQG